MERSSIHILLAAVGFALVSILYFFSLIMGLPVGATLVIWIVVIGVLYWQVFRFLPSANAPAESAVWSMLLMVIILIIGSWQLLRTLPVAEKYGAWDAWWFWNYHAKFLSRPDLWERAYTIGGKELLAARVSHSDYPLMLPSTVGFLWRLLQTTNNLIPFLVGLFFTLLIPLLLLSELARKNILFAGLVFWGLLHNPRYVDVGLTQNADIILAFALLSSFVSMYHYQKDRSRGTLFLWAAGMGMCLWVKNEGIALAVVFFMVYLPVIFRNRENWAALLGIVPFLAALLIFKIGYAPSNDIVSSLAPETLHKLSDGSRYRTVWIGFSDTIRTDYPFLRWLAVLYLIVLVLRWHSLWRASLVLILGIGIYLFAYILSPHNIEWHVNTSITRLTLQFIPSFVFLTVISLCFHKQGVKTKSKIG